MKEVDGKGVRVREEKEESVKVKGGRRGKRGGGGLVVSEHGKDVIER